MSGDKGREGWDPHWPDDGRLLAGAVRNCLSRTKPLWSVVAETFAVGSTVAHAMCQRFGFEPDQVLEPVPRVRAKARGAG
jgi:hypothetical protein